MLLSPPSAGRTDNEALLLAHANGLGAHILGLVGETRSIEDLAEAVQHEPLEEEKVRGLQDRYGLSGDSDRLLGVPFAGKDLRPDASQQALRIGVVTAGESRPPD